MHRGKGLKYDFMHLDVGGVAMSSQNQEHQKKNYLCPQGPGSQQMNLGTPRSDHTLSTSLGLVELTSVLGLRWCLLLYSHTPSHALVLGQKAQSSSHLRSRSHFTRLNGKGYWKCVEAGVELSSMEIAFFSLSFLTQQLMTVEWSVNVSF